MLKPLRDCLVDAADLGRWPEHIRAQLVDRDAGGGLDGAAVLGGDAVLPLPARDGLGLLVADAGERGSTAGPVDGGL